MMLIRYLTSLLLILLGLLRCGTAARAQELTLTKDSEFGFRRLIHSAQTGGLGNDVSNANVGVLKSRVRIELVRMHGANKLLFLTHKSSQQGPSRYFDIELGEGATANDATLLGKVLDEAFQEDPFEVAFDFFGAGADHPIPSCAEAWKYGGWREVLRVGERRLMVPAGITYTVAIIVALASALLASLIVLVTAEPSDRAGCAASRGTSK